MRTPFVEPALRCGNCRETMRRLTLPGHYGLPVELDLCAGCHLVWFDTTETARLSGSGLLGLIGQMAQAQALAHEILRPEAVCPRCDGALKTVHNQTRWGRSLQLECVVRHGAYQSFAQFLAEKGLLRPMSPIDRRQLLAGAGRIDCVNCGAAVGADDACCTHCGSVPSLLDVARLARALDPEGGLAPHRVHGVDPERGALQCAACGAALPAGVSIACAQCGATLAVSRLAEVHQRVVELAPALHALAARPPPALVKRRLDVLGEDLPRRRAWIKEIEADTQMRRSRRADADDEPDWSSLLGRGTNPIRAVFVALAIWFAWYFWPRG